MRKKFSEQYIENHIEQFSIRDIIRYQSVSVNFIDKHEHEIPRNLLFIFQNIPEEHIIKYINSDKYFPYSRRRSARHIINPSEKKKLWDIVSYSQKLSIQFIIDNISNISWKFLSLNRKTLNHDIVSRFKDRLHKNRITIKVIKTHHTYKTLVRSNLAPLDTIDIIMSYI